MRLRLLKNDLLHAKLPNLVMILFIMIATMLACASCSLLYNIQHQISYFMDTMGNVADYNYAMMNVTKEDEEHVRSFMKTQGISEYQIDWNVSLPVSAVHFEGHDDIETSGCLLTTLPETYNLVFDEDNQIPDIQAGEVGVPLSLKQQLDLKLGDTLEIMRESHTYQYRISCFIRDSIYGSDMVGQKRFLLHPDDYLIQEQSTSQKEHALLVSIRSSQDAAQLEYAMQNAGLPNFITVEKETAKLSFLGVGLGTSALLMVSSIVLLCMSFLILRFTILFQIEQNYSEIGILKAIGLCHAQIKPLYTIKYLTLAVLGSIIGFVCSIPLSAFLEELQGGVVPSMPDHTGTYLSLLVVVVLLLVVYFFISLVLHRLKKQSTMDAIRKGNEGESYHPLSKITLQHWKHSSLPLFLAVNELFTHIKNTIMMIVIYALCMLLILIPLTLKDTFQKDAFLQLLNLSIADLYTDQNGNVSIAELALMREQLLKDLQEYDAEVQVEMETLTSASIVEGERSSAAFVMKRADGNDRMVFQTGTQPLLDNEIALSQKLADRYDKTLGDSIVVNAEGVEKQYIITGTYNSMMNLGNNMLVHDIEYDYAFTGYLVVQFSGTQQQRNMIKETVLANYDGIKLSNGEEFMKFFSGDMPNQVKTMADIIIVILLVIAGALTILFAKLHMLRSMHSITLLQSLGASKKNLRQWFFLRCMMQVSIALILGVLIHTMLTARILEFYFLKLGMGNMHMASTPFHTFVLYPLALLIVVLIAQWIVNRSIPDWNVERLREE